MNKILDLNIKEWLTIKDAAKSLSISAGEKVTKADVLRFALDGHLTLSVYFVNGAVARRGELVSFEDTNWTLIPQPFNTPGMVILEDDPKLPPVLMPQRLQKLVRENPKMAELGLMPFMTSVPAGRDQYLNLGEEVFHIEDGVFDLPLIGYERLDVEDAYQQRAKGPAVALRGLNGAFVRDGIYFYQLQETCEDDSDMAGTQNNRKLVTQLLHGDEKSRNEAKQQLQKNSEDRKKHSEVERRHIPAEGLPDDSVLVVRASSLREFVEMRVAEEAKPEKPLHPSERRSAGQIIAVLAAMDKLNLSAEYAATPVMRKFAATHGLELPNSDETIVKFLKYATARDSKA